MISTIFEGLKDLEPTKLVEDFLHTTCFLKGFFFPNNGLFNIIFLTKHSVSRAKPQRVVVFFGRF